MLPVLVMTPGLSRFLTATMIPTRQAGDILAGMWQLISGLGAVTKTLVWDRESAIGGTGRVSEPAAAFAGTLATRIQLAPPRDPEFKGPVERANQFLETSFLPGRTFRSPTEFTDQLGQWLPVAGARTAAASDPAGPRLLRARGHRRLLRRPAGVIGRFVEVVATATEVTVTCEGDRVAAHPRSWAKHVVITDPAHAAAAAAMRQALAHDRRTRAAVTRHHPDGHTVALRALPDYDALFGIDVTAFTPTPNRPKNRE